MFEWKSMGQNKSFVYTSSHLPVLYIPKVASNPNAINAKLVLHSNSVIDFKTINVVR